MLTASCARCCDDSGECWEIRGENVNPSRELLLATGHTFLVGVETGYWVRGKKILKGQHVPSKGPQYINILWSLLDFHSGGEWWKEAPCKEVEKHWQRQAALGLRLSSDRHSQGGFDLKTILKAMAFSSVLYRRNHDLRFWRQLGQYLEPWFSRCACQPLEIPRVLQGR